jgi:hypothetical protein
VKELKAYSDEVAEGIKKSVKDVAKETVRTLKATSPRSKMSGPGKYEDGWTSKVEFESPEDIRMRISNRTKPQLTHLLENGHATVNGDRVDGRPHIRPAEQAAADKLVGAVKVVIKK